MELEFFKNGRITRTLTPEEIEEYGKAFRAEIRVRKAIAILNGTCHYCREPDGNCTMYCLVRMGYAKNKHGEEEE